MFEFFVFLIIVVIIVSLIYSSFRPDRKQLPKTVTKRAFDSYLVEPVSDNMDWLNPPPKHTIPTFYAALPQEPSVEALIEVLKRCPLLDKNQTGYLIRRNLISSGELRSGRDIHETNINNLFDSYANKVSLSKHPSDLSSDEHGDFHKAIRMMDNDLLDQVEIGFAQIISYYKDGLGPAPHFAWRIAVILRKHKHLALEVDFLNAWNNKFKDGIGVTFGKLVEREKKAQSKLQKHLASTKSNSDSVY